LIYELDLDIRKIYLQTNNEVSKFQKLGTEQGRSTHRCTDTHTHTDRHDQNYYHSCIHHQVVRIQLTEPGSRVTDAVNPAALDPLPEVYTYDPAKQ